MSNPLQQAIRPAEAEKFFSDDYYAKALAISRDHLGIPLVEVIAAAVEFLADLTPRKQDAAIRARLATPVRPGDAKHAYFRRSARPGRGTGRFADPCASRE